MDRPAPTAEYSRAANGSPTPEAACCVRCSGGGVIPRLYRDEMVQIVKLAAPVVRLALSLHAWKVINYLRLM